MSKPTVGIVILNYNSHDLTLALAKRTASLPSVDFVCVVDNASGDDFDGEFSEPNIHYIKSRENCGYSAGNNIGLRWLVEECGCEYVYIANPDTIFGDDAIAAIADLFDSDPTVAIASVRRSGHAGASIHQYFDFPTFGSALRSCFFLTRRRFEAERRDRQNARVEGEGSFYVDAVPGAFFGMRSSFLVANGYMYEGIFMYGEEIVLGRQAVLAGFRSAISRDASYVHDHESRRFSSPRAFVSDHKSLVRYFDMFGLLGVPQMALLRVCTALGCAEYRAACAVYGISGRRS